MVHERKDRRAARGERRRIELIADPAAEDEAERRLGHASIFNAQAASVFATVTKVHGSTACGTIDAAIVPVEHQYFGSEGDAMASDRPLPPTPPATEGRPERIRASELITELREIGGQVSRMMDQVERAIDRLAIRVG
jgi:hypothetical protein